MPPVIKQYPEQKQSYPIRPIRWPLINDYVQIFCDKTQVPLGHVKDIHTQGIRLVSEKALTTSEMQINVEIPQDGGKQKRIQLKVCHIWSKSHSRQDLYENGFTIISSPEVRHNIETVVEDAKRLAIELSEKAPTGLLDVLIHYKDTLDKLRTCLLVKFDSGVQKYACEVLKSRDVVQEALHDKTAYPGVVITTIVKLDEELKKQAKNIARKVDLAACRASLNPSATAWWWFFDQSSHRFWSRLTKLGVYLTLAGMVYIVPRLFSGGPDQWGAIYGIVITALTLPGVQSTLQSLPKNAEQFAIKSKVAVIPVIFACMIVYGSIIASPLIADFYRKQGLGRYQAGYFSTALADYNKALALEPDDAQTHFYLGVLYEDLLDLKAARSEYQIAERSCKLTALHNKFKELWYRLLNVSKDKSKNFCGMSLNNLARLYIIDKEYDAAMAVLKRSQDSKIKTYQDQIGHEKLNFFLHKNKGWVLFEQKRIEEAKAQLQYAVEIAEKPAEKPEDFIRDAEKASAYCLLAQVFDALNTPEACASWKKCFDYNDEYLSENRSWSDMARKRQCPPEEKSPQKQGGER